MNSDQALKKVEIDWPVTLFLTLVPFFAVLLSVLYFYFFDVSLSMILFFILFSIGTELSITAGYHRLFSHRSFEATPFLKWVLILVGTSAWQGSVLQWVSGHRQHHAHEDTDLDPYSINKGFWYAHMGWMLFKQDYKLSAHDLQKDPLIQFQHKYYIVSAIFTGFFVPTLIGYFLGDALGGLVLGGFLRIAVTQHFTYFINSLCHTFGDQTYSKEITARDSFLVALLTQGEGYHNYHHQFQADYRNGIKWYHWDPTKWMIRFFWALGLARKLKKMPQQEIIKARLQVESARLKAQGYSLERLEILKTKIVLSQQKIKQLKAESLLLRKEWTEISKARLSRLKADLTFAQLEFEYSMKQWKAYIKNPVSLS